MSKRIEISSFKHSIEWNTNISDGWADPEVHGDTPEVRTQALQMGTNIVVYALMN